MLLGVVHLYVVHQILVSTSRGFFGFCQFTATLKTQYSALYVHCTFEIISSLNPYIRTLVK